MDILWAINIERELIILLSYSGIPNYLFGFGQIFLGWTYKQKVQVAEENTNHLIALTQMKLNF